MFSSLRSRLWLSYALTIITALGMVTVILFVYFLRSPLLYRQTIQQLKAVQTIIIDRDANQSAEVAAQRAAAMFGVRVLFYSNTEQLIFDTAPNSAALDFPRKRVLSRVPLARDENGGAWLYALEKLPDKTYLVIASPRPRLSLVNLFTDDLLPAIFQSGLIALLLSLGAAFIFARWIADPLQKVIAAARAMPEAEMQPVAPQGPHEVQELARAFNSMTERVRVSQKSQREFVANVSHELKTPLTSIQGFAQAILDGTADTESSRQQAAQIIYDESARMHRMVLDLLDLAKLDAGTAEITMSPVQMGALLNSVAEKFAPQLQKAGVEIDVQIEPSLPRLTADGDRLAQVFTNLVDNALKFTPPSGRITLRAAHRNGEALITVSDTGIGIAPEKQARIFERFYQADPSRKGGEKHGAGLGLAIAQEIVRAHGGRIGVRSGLGEGTTFEVILPYNRSDSHL